MQMVYWLAFVVYRGAPRPTWDMGGSWNPDGRWDHGDHLISDFLPRYLGPGQGHGDLDREELLLVVARLPDGGHTQGRVPEVVLEAGLAADAATTAVVAAAGGRGRPPGQRWSRRLWVALRLRLRLRRSGRRCSSGCRGRRLERRWCWC